jgi:hypothetical protein
VDYFEIRDNLLSKRRRLGPVELSNTSIMEIMQKSLELGLIDEIAPNFGVPTGTLAATILQGRLNRGTPLNDGGRNYEHLLLALMNRQELQKSLTLPNVNLPPEDIFTLRDAVKGFTPIPRKTDEQRSYECELRNNILEKALEAKERGIIDSLMVTKINLRLNKRVALSEEMLSALGSVQSDARRLEKAWADERESYAPLMKTRKSCGGGDPEITRLQKAFQEKESLEKSLRVERKDGSTQRVTVDQVRERLVTMALNKSRNADLPLTQVNNLINQIAKGSAEAKRTLESKYEHVLRSLFE